MLEIRRSHQRGYANHGWLDSYHSFSFANYYDAAHMQYSALRVINEDVIAGGTGFDMHPHQDMEIITYVLSGQLRHQDSMGNTSVISAGDVQRMTAGTGVRHSEFNASNDTPVHLLQIWITPSAYGLAPSYEEKHFANAEKQNKWCLIASPDARQQSILIHQDVLLYASQLAEGNALTYEVSAERCVYLQVISGRIRFEQEWLEQGDAAKVSASTAFSLIAEEAAEMLLFDLPKDID